MLELLSFNNGLTFFDFIGFPLGVQSQNRGSSDSELILMSFEWSTVPKTLMTPDIDRRNCRHQHLRWHAGGRAFRPLGYFARYGTSAQILASLNSRSSLVRQLLRLNNNNGLSLLDFIGFPLSVLGQNRGFVDSELILAFFEWCTVPKTLRLRTLLSGGTAGISTCERMLVPVCGHVYLAFSFPPSQTRCVTTISSRTLMCQLP